MRFAYIDSQGKEVGIPSVEALQLRIELGAITAETIFYDASNDRWDPAGDHEIFRRLSREIGERGGGVPRPAAPIVEPPLRKEEGNDSAGEDEPARTRATDPFENEQDPLAGGAEQEEDGWMDPDLEDLDESEVDPVIEAAQDEGEDWDVDLEGIGTLDLAPGIGGPGGDAPPPTPEEPPEPIGVGPSSPADIPEQENGSGMELEKPLAEQVPASSGVVERMEGLAEDFAFDGPMEVEEVAAEGSVVADVADGAQEDQGGAEKGLPSPVGSQPHHDPYDRRVQRPGAKKRPENTRPVPRRRARRPTGLIVGVLAIVAVMGGWLGWSALRGGGEGRGEREGPPAVIPDLPAELEPAMRRVAESAFAEMLDSLRTMALRFSLAEEPNPDWLAGVYLANAGEYDDVAAYWEAFRSYAETVQGADEEIFVDVLRVRLDASEVPAEARDTVFARAQAGFQAAAPDRRKVYGDVEELVEAATDLHEFLIANQASIAYESAAGLSRDPVTEAIPSTPALGEEMWERVGRIPNALEGLGILDRVTTDRILDVILRRLEATGVR